MIREYDIRDEATAETRAAGDDRRRELQAAAARVSEDLPGSERVEVVSFDDTTGGAAVIVSHDARSEGGDYVRRAMEHVQRLSRALGLEPEQPTEFVPDPDYQRTSQGGVAVHLQQLHQGIQVYDGAQTVRFDPGGGLTEVAGRTHPVAVAPNAVPTVGPVEALRAALDFLAATPADAEDDTELDPFGQPLSPPSIDTDALGLEVVTGPAQQPDRATVVGCEQLDGPTTVRLLWFPVAGELRLGWEMVVSTLDGGQWRIVVGAHDGRVLLSRSLVTSFDGTATVRLGGGGAPAEEVTLALPLDRYPVPSPDDLPDGFPDAWLRDASTDGENVRALRVDSAAFVRGDVVDDRVRFAPTDETDDLVVHLFVYNGLMHDLLYLLGFRERDGNFQRSNKGRGGPDGDAVLARVHPGPVRGTANMRTPVDGRVPEMNMGLVASTDRHTALDVDVVVHEYTHGLTNRLVGGPMNSRALDEIQSGGMGEGWGDYFACVLNDRVTVGSWVTGRAGGIRGAAYTEDYPHSFEDVGTGRFDRVHSLGEIWCATLLAMNRRVGTAVGTQLVVDALKLSVANPSFLAMRDAILVAADDYADAGGLAEDERATLRHGVWEAFAKFGMGPGARTDGPSLRGIVADFTTPPRPSDPGTTVVGSASPGLAIPDDTTHGIVSSVALTTDGVLDRLEVSVDIQHTYRGDLEVTLTAPHGVTVLLHDRAGGRQDDLVETWTSDDHADLAQLLSRPAGGDWTLAVVDHAAFDVGVLRSWEVRAQVSEARPVEELVVTPSTSIPDDDPEGIVSVVEATGAGALRGVTLDLDITHTYIGDLEVVLRAPGGQEVTLHDREGGRADNIVESFGSGPGEALAPLVGVDGTGEWQLHVVDTAGLDVGKLNRWRLVLER